MHWLLMGAGESLYSILSTVGGKFYSLFVRTVSVSLLFMLDDAQPCYEPRLLFYCLVCKKNVGFFTSGNKIDVTF